MADVAFNSQTADGAAAMEQHNYFGKLIFLDMDGLPEKELAIFKNSTILGRDKINDVYISRREVSRRHMEVSVDKDGSVSVVSLGREPVTVNGKVVVTPTELFSGDVIEIALEGRAKQIMFEGNEATVQLNHSLVMGARQPLGESNQITETAPSAGKASGRKSTPFKSRKTPQKSDGKPSAGPAFSAAVSAAPSAAGFAPPPPAPPPPGPGRLLRSQAGPPLSAASATAVKKGPPPPPPPPPKGASLGAAISAAALKRSQSAASQQPAVAAPKPVKLPVPAPAGGQLVPSAADLQALRAGLRKTRRQSVAEQQQDIAVEPEVEEVPASPAVQRQSVGKGRSKSATPAAKQQSIGKRKSVRFNLPAPVPSSPEGIVADATCSLVTIPEHTDAINIDADSTHAFSAWAMGSAAAANATAVLPDFPALSLDRGDDGTPLADKDLLEEIDPDQEVTGANQQISSSYIEDNTMGVGSSEDKQGDEAEYMDTEEIAPVAADGILAAEQGAHADPAEGDSTLPAADFAAVAEAEAAAPLEGVAPGAADADNLQTGEIQDTEKAAGSTPDDSLALELAEGSPIDSGSAGDVQMESMPEEEGFGSEAAAQENRAALVLQLRKANKRARVYFTKAKLHEAAIDRLSKANLLLRRQVSSLKAQLQQEGPPAQQPSSAPTTHVAPLPPAVASPDQLDVPVVVVGRSGASPASATLHRCGSVTVVGTAVPAQGKAGTKQASIPRPVFSFAGKQMVPRRASNFVYGGAASKAPAPQPDEKEAGVDEMVLDSKVEVSDEQVTHSLSSGWDLAFLAENKAASQKSREAVKAMLTEAAACEQAPTEGAQQLQQASSQPVACGWGATFLQQNKEASQKSTEAIQAMLETANKEGIAGLSADEGILFGEQQPAMPSIVFGACASPFTRGHAVVRDIEDKGLGQAVNGEEAKELSSLLSKPKKAAEVLVDADTTFAFSAWAMGTQAVAPAALATVRVVQDQASTAAASGGPLLLLDSASLPEEPPRPTMQMQGQGPEDAAGPSSRDNTAEDAVAPHSDEQADKPPPIIISREPAAADSTMNAAAQGEATSPGLKDDLGTQPSQANDVAEGTEAADPSPVAPLLPVQPDSCPGRSGPASANAAEESQEATAPSADCATMDAPQASAVTELLEAWLGADDKEQAASSKAALQVDASAEPAVVHCEAVTVEDDCTAAGQKEAATISEQCISAEDAVDAAQDVLNIVQAELGNAEEDVGKMEAKAETGSAEEDMGMVDQKEEIDRTEEDVGMLEEEEVGSAGEEEEDEPCLVCGESDEGDVMVVCETCEQGAHLACAKLKKVPKGDWFCKGCRPSAAAVGSTSRAGKASQATAPAGRKTRRGAEGAVDNGPENSIAPKAQPATKKQAGKTAAAKPAAVSKAPRRQQPEGEAEAAPRLRSRGSKDPAKASSEGNGKAKASAPSKDIAKTETRATRGRDAKLAPAAADNLPAKEVTRKRAHDPQEAAKPGKKAKVAAAPAASKRTRAQLDAPEEDKEPSSRGRRAVTKK